MTYHATIHADDRALLARIGRSRMSIAARLAHLEYLLALKIISRRQFRKLVLL